MTLPELPADDTRRFQAALLVAAKLWERRNSPIGVAGGYETGVAYIRGKDPDVTELLIGLRRRGSDLSQQTWPTTTDLRAHAGIAGSTPDAELQQSIDSAIGIVTRICTGGFGIA